MPIPIADLHASDLLFDVRGNGTSGSGPLSFQIDDVGWTDIRDG